MKAATKDKPLFKRGSQNDRIYRRLKAARGGWVSLPKLVEASGSYAVATRVSNINEALLAAYCASDTGAHQCVMNRTERRPDGTTASFYRLVQ